MMAMVFSFTVSSFQLHNESTMHQFVVAYLTSSLGIVTMISLILIGINPPNKKKSITLWHLQFDVFTDFSQYVACSTQCCWVFLLRSYVHLKATYVFMCKYNVLYSPDTRIVLSQYSTNIARLFVCVWECVLETAKLIQQRWEFYSINVITFSPALSCLLCSGKWYFPFEGVRKWCINCTFLWDGWDWCVYETAVSFLL